MPHASVLGIVAAQLDVPPGLWEHYAAREETRREHAMELMVRLGLEPFRRSLGRELVTWLVPLAMQTRQGAVLAEALVAEFRSRRVALPSVLLIEMLCAQAATRAERAVFRRLTELLTTEHRQALDDLLVITTDRSLTRLG